MAKNIQDGVEQIKTHLQENQDDQRLRAWRDLRNKVDSLLLSTNVFKSDEAKRQCLELDTMNGDERKEHISKFWGPAYLLKTEPLLHQLTVLETAMAKEQEGQEES